MSAWDYRVLLQLQQCAQSANLPLEVLEDTHFMSSRDAFKQWAGSLKSLRMEFFYRNMRKQHGILMQGDQPEGGTWNFDAENRQSFGKQGPGATPPMPSVNVDDITHHVQADVRQYFPDHPGSLAHFCWPVTRQEALTFLQIFVEDKLALFGAYQDAMWQGDLTQSPFLWHSLLASSLNLKLLDPREVIAAAVNAYHQRKLPLASVEGFVRQILGWREFIRGVYWLDMPQLAEANHYGHQRDLPVWFWTGNTQHAPNHTANHAIRLCSPYTASHGHWAVWTAGRNSTQPSGSLVLSCLCRCGRLGGVAQYRRHGPLCEWWAVYQQTVCGQWRVH